MNQKIPRNDIINWKGPETRIRYTGVNALALALGLNDEALTFNLLCDAACAAAAAAATAALFAEAELDTAPLLLVDIPFT